MLLQQERARMDSSIFENSLSLIGALHSIEVVGIGGVKDVTIMFADIEGYLVSQKQSTEDRRN